MSELHKDLIYPVDRNAGMINGVKIHLATNDFNKYMNFYFYNDHYDEDYHKFVGSISLSGNQVKDFAASLADIYGMGLKGPEKATYRVSERLVNHGHKYVVEKNMLMATPIENVAYFKTRIEAEEYINFLNSK